MRSFMKMPNEQGYTFLESIFQLIILTIFIHLFLLFFFWKGQLNNTIQITHPLNGNYFQLDLQYLLSDVSEIRLVNAGRTIRLKNSRGLIDIEQSGTVIRKRVDGTGHVPLVTGVKCSCFYIRRHDHNCSCDNVE